MKMSLPLVLAAGSLLLAGFNLSAAEKADPKYRFAVSMDRWDCDGNRGVWDQAEVKVNGAHIGRYEKGFRELELLPVENGECIKLEFPACPNAKTCQPAHWISSFIHRWMEKGAFVDWYEAEENFETHTVTWTDYRWGWDRGQCVKLAKEERVSLRILLLLKRLAANTALAHCAGREECSDVMVSI